MSLGIALNHHHTMDNIYMYAAMYRKGLISRGIDKNEASKLVSNALNSSSDYKSAIAALRAL